MAFKLRKSLSFSLAARTCGATGTDPNPGPAPSGPDTTRPATRPDLEQAPVTFRTPKRMIAFAAGRNETATMKSRADEAVQIAEEILGRPVDRVERMVASSVRAIRLHSGDETMVAARRPGVERAALEATVLTELGRHGAPVPRLIAQRGRWVFQQDLAGERLSAALWSGSGDTAALLDRALESQAQLHEAGRSAGLERRIAPLGLEQAWRQRLAAMPGRLGEMTDLPAPRYEAAAAARQLAPRTVSLIKWDARPANAMLTPDGSIAWFDWEHCGCRDPLDDAAWLLGDEYMPDIDNTALIDRAVALMAGENGPDAARAYLVNFGVLHMSVRLALILSKRNEYGGWRDWETCLKLDKVGSTAASFRRTAQRASRWAAGSGHLTALAPWFEAMADRTGDE